MRQVLPVASENDAVLGFVNDPLMESDVMPAQGVVYKYRSRALVVVTGACAIHCRYCFRRHFPYSEHTVSSSHWVQLRAFLERHPQVNEVILSGGDPLSVSTRRLMPLLDVIKDFPQIRRLRFHTRLPVVVPERINEAFLAFLEQVPIPIVIVLHVNHSQELGEELALAVSALRTRGVWVLNQSVLLKGVNDRLDVLLKLSEQLFSMGILPYYLHLLDSVAGAAHFFVPVDRAQRLYGELLSALPGFLVPRLVREDPGQPSKTWLSPCYTE